MDSPARRRERGVSGPAEAGHHHSRFTLTMRPASSNRISTIQPSSPCRRWPVLIAAKARNPFLFWSITGMWSGFGLWTLYTDLAWRLV